MSERKKQFEEKENLASGEAGEESLSNAELEVAKSIRKTSTHEANGNLARTRGELELHA